MGFLSYYLAISLDGFLAREDGSVDWLDPYFAQLDSPYDFEPYYESVEALVMGRATFEACMSLGGGSYPYQGNKPAWVITSNPDYRTNVAGVGTLVPKDPSELVEIVATTKGRVWLVGGGVTAGWLIEHSLIDELVLTIIPVTLGKGIPWLRSGSVDRNWQYKEIHHGTNGVVQLVYGRRPSQM